jgi:hypothetical protein
MNKVEQYIEEQNKIIQEDKEQTLIALGLVEKEYSPYENYDSDYPEYEFVDGKSRYYRLVAIKVTDEEYERVLSKKRQAKQIKKELEILNNEDCDANNYKSPAAKVLRIVYYILFVVAIIGALILNSKEEINIIPYVIIGGIVEMVFVEALASILDYLAELTYIARNNNK